MIIDPAALDKFIADFSDSGGAQMSNTHAFIERISSKREELITATKADHRYFIPKSS